MMVNKRSLYNELLNRRFSAQQNVKHCSSENHQRILAALATMGLKRSRPIIDNIYYRYGYKGIHCNHACPWRVMAWKLKNVGKIKRCLGYMPQFCHRSTHIHGACRNPCNSTPNQMYKMYSTIVHVNMYE